MPIYEYVCHGCDYRFEVKQGFNDPPLTACERCGGEITKLISAPAIMFKGSGWYITDYSDKLKPPDTGQKPKDAKRDDSQKQGAPAAVKDGSGSGNGSSTGSGGGNVPPSSPSSSSPPSSSAPSSPPSSSSSSS